MDGIIDGLAALFNGTALVCGTAPCLYKEHEIALDNRPNATIIGVNNAPTLIWCHFLSTLHPKIATQVRQNSVNPKLINTSAYSVNIRESHEDYDIDFWFTGCGSRATSTISAARCALKMGFDEVIIVGAPMVGGDGDLGRFSDMDKRFGEHKSDSRSIVTHQKHLLATYKDFDFKKVRSMSGFTAQIFGVPNFISP